MTEILIFSLLTAFLLRLALEILNDRSSLKVPDPLVAHVYQEGERSRSIRYVAAKNSGSNFFTKLTRRARKSEGVGVKSIDFPRTTQAISTGKAFLSPAVALFLSKCPNCIDGVRGIRNTYLMSAEIKSLVN